MASVVDKLHSIHADLRFKILGGTFKIGERLPTTNELALTHECSVVTAGKVIAMLVHEGLVEQRRGLGTRVIERAAAPASVELDAFAFIYSTEKHEGIWRTVSGFQDAAREMQRRTVMLSTGTDFDKEIEYLNRLTEFDVRGAVLYPNVPTLKDRMQLANRLVESKFPVVLVDINLLGTGIPSVVVDGFHAGCVMTRHLLARGARRIGFLANQAWAPSVTERFKGYCWALEEAGLPVEMDLVMLENDMRPNVDDPLSEPRALAATFLERGGTLDAVTCANDFMARGLIQAAQARGLSVPGDLKVAGIDGFSQQPEGEIALTTYRVPFERVGRTAFEVLNAVLNKEPQAEIETRIRGELVARESA